MLLRSGSSVVETTPPKSYELRRDLPIAIDSSEMVLRSGRIRSDGTELTASSAIAPHIGRAVIARRRYRCGEDLCSYGGQLLDNESYEALLRQHTRKDCPRIAYLAYVTKQYTVDGYPALNDARGHLGNFVNDPRGIDGARANVRFCYAWSRDNERRLKRVRMTLRAIRTINEGDELWLDYGGEYWAEQQSKQCEPCSCESNHNRL